MSAILNVLGALLLTQKDVIISLAISGVYKLCEFFQPQKRKGIVLLEESAQYLMTNLVNSKKSYLVDLHSQINTHLDADDIQAIENAPDDLSRKELLYPRVSKLTEDIMNVLRQSTVVFFHWDLELLKFLQCRDMLYFLPSDQYVQALIQANPNFDQARFMKYKQLLMSSKSQKVVLYTTNTDLQNLIIAAYSDLQIKS